MTEPGISLICATAAGFVRWLWLWDLTNWKRWLKIQPTAILVGFLAYKTCLYFDIDKDLIPVLAGMAGLCSPEVLWGASKITIGKIDQAIESGKIKRS